ncbi:MAG: type II toxin-antitoxin system HipA family toxin [Gemmatimonadota bacterium]|nr:type II toxin-antitoxin system HipA family toxin [Gemmatimonadota bacterium]
MNERLVALADGRKLGEIGRDARGRLGFQYDDVWSQDDAAYPLSLSMPTTVRNHGHERIEPWLWGLLPDNENVLTRWARQFHVSARNAFSLLKATGEDCPGAVQFVRPERVSELLASRPVGVSTSDAVSESREVAWLTTAEVETRLRTLRHDNSAWRLEGDVGQFSLAGAQSKTALLLEDGRWGVPHGATPTTHILKPPIVGFSGHCENEHLCLQLADALGIPAARSRVNSFGQETAIVVDRYDRIALAGRLVRLHQEDLCQALARSPFNKYESDGGPGCRDIAGAIQSYCTRPGEDVRTFVRANALNWMIGGTDAHARNFSLLIGTGGNVRLAPLYDVASVLPYPGQYARKLKLAMKIGGESRLGYIQVRHWERFAAEVGLPPDEVLGICESVAIETPDRLADVVAAARSEGLDHPVVERLKEGITKHASACLERLRR